MNTRSKAYQDLIALLKRYPTLTAEQSVKAIEIIKSRYRLAM